MVSNLQLSILDPLVKASVHVGRVSLPIIGVYVGYRLKAIENRSSEISNRIDELVDQLEKIAAAGAAYWKRDTRQKGQNEEDIVLEAEIQSRVHGLLELFEGLANNFKLRSVQKTRDLISEVRQATTSRDFAADDGHGASSAAILLSFQTCQRLQSHLRLMNRYHRQRFWKK